MWSGAGPRGIDMRKNDQFPQHLYASSPSSASLLALLGVLTFMSPPFARFPYVARPFLKRLDELARAGLRALRAPTRDRVLRIRFKVTRLTDGGFAATCSALGVHVTAATVAELEEKLKLRVSSLYDDDATAGGTGSVPVVVRRRYPRSERS
jgi:hypothetical protein